MAAALRGSAPNSSSPAVLHFPFSLEVLTTLAYLADVPIERVRGLTGKRGRDLKAAGFGSVADLLLHPPRRYIDRSHMVRLDETPLGEEVTVIGTVKDLNMRRVRSNLAIIDAVIFDGETYLEAVWFNQKFRMNQLAVGAEVALSGKVERKRGRLRMSSPVADVLDRPGESLVTGRVVPVHPTVAGVGPGYLRRAIHNALLRSGDIADPVPAEIVERLGLIDRHTAIWDIHFPAEPAAAESARARLVFDELFRLELALAIRKHRQIDEAVGIAHDVGGDLVERFIGHLPYTLTAAQRRVLAEIQKDMAAPHPMHRLLQGEVGSGKTVVAVAALLTSNQGGYQGAVMAPTEVLAEQHYLGITDLMGAAGMAPALEGAGAALGMDSLFTADDRPVTMALLTSNNSEVNFRPRGATPRAELLDWIASGRIDVVVGTHALIQEGVHFARLGAAVVDEQHRFGVHQRVQLREKGGEADPDLLIMTATPIPRTLSMTLYGDLDMSLLDELPPGRTPTKTIALGPAQEATWLELVRREAAAGRQAFVVCPLVEDSPKVEAASATAEYERLSGLLPELEVGLLHGQMRPVDKEAVMAAMRAAELDVLVATTVIEVGIDIPNATVIVIEDADRFGLSQLHQLRGRVGRGSHPATCVLVAEPTTDDGSARIAAMVATTDGFRLAEEDLRIRGQGTVFGARQAGMGDLRIADILRDAEALIVSRREAFALVGADPELSGRPELVTELRALLGDAAEWLFIS